MNEILRKRYRICAAAILSFVLAACSTESVETGDPVAIGFEVGASRVEVNSRPVTRAEIEDDTPAIDQVSDMVGDGVLIYGKRYTGAASPWTTTDDIFMSHRTGTVVQRGLDAYGIAYSPVEYYDPAGNKKYDFRLIYPAPVGTGDASGVTLLPSTAELPVGLRVNLYRRPDMMIATAEGVTKREGNVPVKFEHMLTRINFRIIKDDALTQSIFLNRFLVAGVIRGTYDVLGGRWLEPNKNLEDPDVDAATGASILVPGYNTDEKFEIPGGTEPKPIREMFLFPVPADASKLRDDFDRYFFDIWFNERRYSFSLPYADGTEWKPGEQYTYTLRISATDIYIEVDGPIQQEQWNDIPVEEIEVGTETKRTTP